MKEFIKENRFTLLRILGASCRLGCAIGVSFASELAGTILYLVSYALGASMIIYRAVLDLFTSRRIGEKLLMTVASIAAIVIGVLGLFIAFVLMLSIHLSRKWLIFVPSVLFAILLCVNITIYDIQREKFVRAEYLSGDTLVLSSSNGVYICDASDGTYGNLYESVAIAKENCFTEIDGIILTHYHSKHVVSLERLAKNYKIHSVLLPKPQNSDEDLIMRSIVRVLSKENVEVYVFDNERDLEILSGELSISSRAYIAGYAHPSIAISFAYGDERITLIEKPYFDTYIEESGAFDEHIANSDYLIFGADGRNPQQNFEIFSNLNGECEVSFADFEFMNKSDFEDYLGRYRIYFGVEYKKYALK